MFSTVRGHVFRWTLLKDEDAVHQELGPEAILEFVRFTESAYTTDNITEALEIKASHLILRTMHRVYHYIDCK